MVRKHRRTRPVDDWSTPALRIGGIKSDWIDVNTLAVVLGIEPKDVMGYPDLPTYLKMMGIGPVWDTAVIRNWLIGPQPVITPYWDEDLA